MLKSKGNNPPNQSHPLKEYASPLNFTCDHCGQEMTLAINLLAYICLPCEEIDEDEVDRVNDHTVWL